MSVVIPIAITISIAVVVAVIVVLIQENRRGNKRKVCELVGKTHRLPMFTNVEGSNISSSLS
jgi:low affinity Fe/Cu permease